uniref:Peptidase S1 domain-containing protein n=1 Tax=Parascaris equorum TaxID=6256 RepID=A0A914RR55_PAREQ
MPLGWQIKCTQERCVVDGQKKCPTGAARVRCPSNDDLFADDIALIELDEDIRFGKYVQPICLPPVEFDYEPGKKCVVSGWGSIGEIGD